MFETVVAGVLNRFLGKYVQDLDTENLNIGIFSGDVHLTDLKLKPEALYELNLPIDVKIGTIGQISFQIPWSGLYSQPIIVNVHDVLLLVGPVVSNNFFDGEREKRLIRAAKKLIIEKLESASEIFGEPKNFLESLVTTIVNNIQIFVRNIHIRYEDTVTFKDGSLACGLCLQSLTIETTNSKWKPALTPQGCTTVYQMIKLESLSVYWNPNAVVLDDEETRSINQNQFLSWRHYMINGLEKFSMHGEDFEFLLKPVSCKIKVIVNRSGEVRVPRLLVDSVIQDGAAQISRKQYLSICTLIDSFKRMSLNRKYRHLHPKLPVTKNSKKWWKYAYDSVLEQRVKPYTWQAIKLHRENYQKYKDTYKNSLKRPNDTEMKLDLQKCEDNLPILSIVIAREHAKIELKKENPETIEVKESELDWWNISSPNKWFEEVAVADIDYKSTNYDLCVKHEKLKGLWSHLSSPEKKKVCEIIGYVEGDTKSEKPKLYIEHKINLTIANFSLTLVNRSREILVVTLTQFLSSLETRPFAKAFKASVRTESIVVEGINTENDLIPIVTADNVFTNNTSTNFLALDFEKNPMNTEADFGLNISIEPLEMVYNEHTLSEVMNFFQTKTMGMKDVVNIFSTKLESFISKSKSLFEFVLSRKKIININMNIKGPYVIIPESGSFYKSGNVLVIDFGKMTVKTDLQPLNNQLEDATCMELEERLYDRLHVDCSAVQVFFCDSGEEWRNCRKQNDSDLHLIPKVRLQMVFSNSIKQDYELLPRHKLNLSISNFKINLSDRRIGALLEYFDNLPLPSSNTLNLTIVDCSYIKDMDANLKIMFKKDKVPNDQDASDLIRMKRKLVLYYLHRSRMAESEADSKNNKDGVIESDKSIISVDHSDEDAEIWARTIDLPGFEDNVSPNNNITVLMRFVIGEVVLQLSRSLDTSDRPYIMLRMGKFCLDIALMKYGPAFQLSLQTLMLCDKLHQSTSGEYVELITTDPNEEVFNILYRKVKADCPDFKKYFHNVEQSLVADIGSVNVIFHRESWQTLMKYLTYMSDKVKTRETIAVKKFVYPHTKNFVNYLMGSENDPPIPPGATKFSYSFRLSQLRVKLTNSDIEIMDIKISGLESDCVFKANERMILKVFLNNFTVEDLSEITLYNKMVWVDEDKVFELKYVRFSPRIVKGGLMQNDDVKSDGSLRLYFGRLNVVLLYKVLFELQHFVEPFTPHQLIKRLYKNAEKGVENQLSNIKSWQTKINISVEVHAPIFLLPQKSSSPNLIVFNVGDLTLENFFKEISQVKSIDDKNISITPVIDNILVKLDSISLNRAVMTLAGSLELQESILDPVSVRFDVKRTIGYHNIVGSQTSSFGSGTSKEILLYDIDGIMDVVNINLGQRDLFTIVSIWNDNFIEGQYIGSIGHYPPSTPPENNEASEASVQKLQDFFAQSDLLKKEVIFRFTLEGIEVKVFVDIDEILSSPVRDSSRALAKIAAGEATFQLDYFSNRSIEMKGNLQTLLIEDVRPDTAIIIKRIFQSHAGEMHHDCAISVSTPPILDFTFRQNQSRDSNIDVRIEKTRLNFSVPFFMNLARFIIDALPDKSSEGGVVNHGYVGDSNVNKQDSVSMNHYKLKSQNYADSASGYYTIVDESPGISLSVQMRKPEVMFFSDLSKTSGHALLFRTEILLDYSKHSGQENLTLSFSSLQIMSKLQSKLKASQEYFVLHPCDIEFARSLRSSEEGVRVSAVLSQLDIHLSETTVHTVADIIEDIKSDLASSEDSETFNFLLNPPKMSEKVETEDLWTPKKIVPCISANEDSITYSHIPYCDIKPSETFNLSVPRIRILFEIEAKDRIPLLMVKSTVEVSVQDWSKQMHGKCEITLIATYYNEKINTWEPLIEPVFHEDHRHRPWSLIIKGFQAKSYQMSSSLDSSPLSAESNSGTNVIRQLSSHKKQKSESETSGDESDVENGMVFIRHKSRSKDDFDGAILAGDFCTSSLRYGSDSENEDGAMEKLASAIGHLFTGDSSEEGNSESDSSAGDHSEMESEHDNTANKSKTKKRGTAPDPIEEQFGNFNAAMKAESVDSGLEAENSEKSAIYILIDARDKLNITLTPQCMKVIFDITTHFSQRTLPVTDYHDTILLGYENDINLINDIGPGSKVELVSHSEQDLTGNDRVIISANYDKDYSCPSSPAMSTDGRNMSDDILHDWETFEGGFQCDIRTPTPQPMLSPTQEDDDDPVTLLYRRMTDERLVIKTHDFEDMKIVCPQRAVNKVHPLNPCRNNTRYYIIVNTDTKYKNRKILIRSPLQIRNETSYAIGLFYHKSDLEALKLSIIGEQTNPFEGSMRIHVLEPDETYNVPLYIAYHCKLYFQPTYVDNYQVTSKGLWWPEFSEIECPLNIQCIPKDEKENTVFSMRVLTGEGCQIRRNIHAIPNHIIRLLPPLIIHDRLPYAVEIKIAEIDHHTRIEAGEKTTLYHLNLGKSYKVVVEMNYMGLPWTGCFTLNSEFSEKILTMTTDCDTDGGNKQLGLNLKMDKKESCELFIHAPYWIINKTGLPLQIRGSSSDVVYECQGSEPLLFHYKRIVRRRRVRLRIYQSSWSSAFGLETVGSSGLIVCKHRERNRKYRLLMNISLSQLCPQLTKIITILPYFLVTNDTKKNLRFMEENEAADLWMDLAPAQCLAFWPETDSMKLHCKFRDSSAISQHFPIVTNHSTVLKMDKGAALCVDVFGGIDKPFTITFRPYHYGDVPVRIDNLCKDIHLKFNQSSSDQIVMISPNQSVLYTWDDPSKERTLLWNVYNCKGDGFTVDYLKDGYGEERVSLPIQKQTSSSGNSVTSKLSSTLKKLTPKQQENESNSDESDDQETKSNVKTPTKSKKNKVVVYWVSYLDNFQRVFLLTLEERVAQSYRRKIDSEKCNYELFCSVTGIGISVCMQGNNGLKELSYISFIESPPRWEVNVAQKWKLLSADLTAWMEEKYKFDVKKCQLKEYIHIDFEKMQMNKPFFGELRRSYNPAIWVQYRKSETQRYFHLKINKFQVDNQLYEAVFPSVIYPSPLPPEIARKIGPKPFVEFISLKRKTALNQTVYKYIKLLVQEFSIQLDRGFVSYIFEILNQWTLEEKPALRLRTDLALVHAPITNMAVKRNSDGNKNMFIEKIHLSPLKIRLSLSSRDYSKESQNTGIGSNVSQKRPKLFNSDVLEFLFNSWSSCLSEMKGVKFRLSFFECFGKITASNQLICDVYQHYFTQMIQQFYVLVLGLDILGNPYNKISIITTGKDFYYEPYMGISEGPEEIANRLAYGGSSLLGHNVGSISKSPHLLNQTLGEFVSNISFENEHKLKRKHGFDEQKHSDLPISLLSTTQTYVMGVTLCLGGLIMKPIFGGRHEYIEGILRNCGGILVAAGVKAGGLESASLALDTLRRASDFGKPIILRERLPRFCHSFEGIKPYSFYDALGLRLLSSIGRGHYTDTDQYLAHAPLTANAKTIILLTIQHVFYVKMGSGGEMWRAEWILRMDDVIGVPTVENGKLKFNVRQDDSATSSTSEERLIECEDLEILKWIQSKVEMALIMNMEDKSCPSQI